MLNTTISPAIDATPNMTTTLTLLDYCQALIHRQSITPNDADCQEWLISKLEPLGFDCTRLQCEDVSNLIAVYGDNGPLLAFCGHTDVVPPGDVSEWHVPPFSAEIVENEIYGRGITDMKGGIASMLCATERFIRAGGADNVRIMFLITSDEEGEAEYGSTKIVDYLQHNELVPDFCLIGEPSSREQTGDRILLGRRGSISGKITVKGKLGHVAYPTMKYNAAHLANQVMTDLLAIEWDQGTTDFPGTSLQVTGIETSSFVDNLVPEGCDINFNTRYSHKYSEADIKQLIVRQISLDCENYKIDWSRPCAPYMSHTLDSPTSILNRLRVAIDEVKNITPITCATGGTSDGRFFSEICPQVVELGLPNSTIHQVNERVKIADLVDLENIYYQMLVNF